MRRASQHDLYEAMNTSAMLVSILFLVEAIDFLFPVHLDNLGIVPRTIRGLIGVFFSPFLHGDFAHLIANACPLFVLLILLFWDHRYRPAETLILIWYTSGLCTWLIGRPNTIHIGASSIIYGLVAYFIAAGLFMRSWRAAGIAVLVFIFYGGIFIGVLPHDSRIPVSWEGHLSGAIAGVWAARRIHI